MVDKNAVFKFLDSRIGRDLIVSVHEAKEYFNLTDHEFYPIYVEWEKLPIQNK